MASASGSAAAGEEKTRGAYEERVVKIKRCAAVVKGGRRFSFAAMVVVGDGEGRVGWGYGKANEVPPSVEKAVKQATRSMVARRRSKAVRFRTSSRAATGRLACCWCRPARVPA